MATLFYLLLVWFGHIHFSWWWLFISMAFNANDARTVYRYTTDKYLEGKNADK